MTIKELKEHLEHKIADEKNLSLYATCKYSEGLHDGHSLGLQEALYYISYLEVKNDTN